MKNFPMLSVLLSVHLYVINEFIISNNHWIAILNFQYSVSADTIDNTAVRSSPSL